MKLTIIKLFLNILNIRYYLQVSLEVTIFFTCMPFGYYDTVIDQIHNKFKLYNTW